MRAQVARGWRPRARNLMRCAAIGITFTLPAGCAGSDGWFDALFAPIFPSASSSAASLAAEEPWILTFTAPMDASRTEAALRLSVRGADGRWSPAPPECAPLRFTWNGEGTRLALRPAGPWVPGRTWRVDLTREAATKNGVLLDRAFSWTRLAGRGDEALLVTFAPPADPSTPRPVLTLRWSRPVKRDAASSVTVRPDPGASWTWASPTEATLTFSEEVPWGSDVTVEVDAGVKAEDGVALAESQTFRFRRADAGAPPELRAVAASSDPRPAEAADLRPALASPFAVPGARPLSRFEGFVFIFSKPMRTSSVEDAFRVTPSVPGRWTHGQTARGFESTWSPDEPFAAGSDAVVTLTAAALDLSGRSLAAPWTGRLRFDAADSKPLDVTLSADDGAGPWTVGAVHALPGGLSNARFTLRFSAAVSDRERLLESVRIRRVDGAGGEPRITRWDFGGTEARLEVADLPVGGHGALLVLGGPSGLRDLFSNALPADREFVFEVPR